MNRWEVRAIALMGEHMTEDDYVRLFGESKGKHLWRRHYNDDERGGFHEVLIKADFQVLDILAKEAERIAAIESGKWCDSDV